MLVDAAAELLRERDVLAQQRPQPLRAVAAQHPPQLQRAEAAPERDVPVAVVDHLAGVAGGVAQVRPGDRERVDQRLAIGHPQHVAVEVREQPLVRVERVAIGALGAALAVAVLLAEHRRAGPGGVDVVPEAVLAGDVRDGRDRVDGAGAGRADGARDDRGMQAVGAVLLDRARERLGPQRERVVDVELAHVLEARELRPALDRGVRLRGPVRDEPVRGAPAPARARRRARGAWSPTRSSGSRRRRGRSRS